MRKGIVLKLFTLTTALCMLILATIFIGQTIFFKQYYANRKVEDIKVNLNSFEKSYLNYVGNTEEIKRLEQDFLRENNTWITTLDQNGNLKHADDFYFEVAIDRRQQKSFGQQIFKIPLYNLINIEEIDNKSSNAFLGQEIYFSGVKKDDSYIPFSFTLGKQNLRGSNKPLEKAFQEKMKLDEEKKRAAEEQLAKEKKPAVQEESAQELDAYIVGGVTKVQLPDVTGPINPIYKNSIFLDNIKEFQTNLLLKESKHIQYAIQTMDYEKNDIKYKLLVKPITERDGSVTYIYAMASLQPVDEAVQMVQDYYIYIIAFVLVLIFLASFYYSKQIAKPLLKINDTTKKIAHLDFTEQIPITSKDEIGDLSKNINALSTKLHSHIGQLEQDIEKERKLENTRKEFISGVSHELKTPLSIMKSCISILKDGVAEHKKEYYFQAMEREVDKMDTLILDMLELAKFESGTYKMKKGPFYIDAVIEDICEHLSVEIEKKELHVHKNICSFEVVANQGRIEQVIVNFITNAIRYTPNKEDIMISTIDEKDRIKVCIENKGTHIEEEQLDKIWDRFYRVDAARQRSQGGTGLGLAISKNILELHEAEYGVKNTEDGVLFYFYLPKKA
ncbi:MULTISPECIES: cell wall metabolism sensor histidine kinase WalK [Bacillus]|uniref:histidine kinase n=1 Tax=Bacillus thuringiensis serovar sooncheon TaxID=180891 RepID=A0A9Q5X2B6_BACTU|nr:MULTISPECIES: HAMP domain-containing sensor histidine kinase [Bacillus]MDC7975719.1 HAMP domain-containing sensor histidine kinase [Bacillus sp. BLCC-B18]OTW68589.1 two-component sensor histidine kinase [Bacillus thuringiensis serovar coreanensis]OTX42095.1 two-component sensor histidine kinase [Bacillus thuringiensis serovar sooncheon]OTX51320.1 two-component sensor histidine kinase [Bacillus thuringiensis serovar guiyangiensis]OTX66298.1 two-component sensor histidine kinase [Bacillus thu